MAGSPTAWDDFFTSHSDAGCWIIAHLNDGATVGGRFSKISFASAFPREGHIYIQELWELDDDSKFIAELPGPQGVLLRPSDYKYLQVFKAKHQYD